MRYLWSPWRSRYLREYPERARGEEDRSLFRRLWEEDRDRENLVLWRGEVVFVVLNRYPYNRGHLMVLPNRQVVGFRELTGAERDALMHAVDRSMGWVEEALGPTEFQVGMNLGRSAGAGLPDHLHVHVVPRWREEEGLPHRALEPGELPAALEEVYDELRAAVGNDRSAS